MIEQNRNRRRRRRALTLLLALALLLPVTVAFSAGRAGPDADSPTLTLVVTGVDETYVEVGLSVSASKSDGSYQTFRSAGAVLRYDAGLLQPVEWETDAPVEQSGLGWANAAPLFTKGPDMLSGKTALAYTADRVGYLYLLAEAPKTLADFTQTLPVTTPLTEAEGAPLMTAAGLPVLAPATEEATGEDAATTLVPTDVLETPVEQVVVTRFKLAAGADLAAAIASVDLVTGVVAEDSYLYDTSGAAYYPGAAADNPAAAGESIPVNLQLLRVPSGTTYFTGGGGGPAETSDFFPVVFYDWDGVTLLGSKIVAKVDRAAQQQELIDAALLEMQAELSATEEQLNGKLWYNSSELPLTNKKGYTFGKWIDFDAVDENGNEVYTSYGKAVSVVNRTQIVDIEEPAGHVFSQDDYNNGITLKAAYQTNADIDALEDLAATRDYTVGFVSYLQFGSSNDVGIAVHVKRENIGEQGVHRVRKLGLRIMLDIDMGDGVTNTIYSLQELDNQDDITVQIAVNSQVSSVRAEVIDLCDIKSMTGTTNWAGAAAARSNTASQVVGGDHTNPGFVHYGIVGFFNDAVKTALAGGDTGEQIRTNKSVTGIHQIVLVGHYNKISFDLDTVKGATATGTLAKRRGALANIFEAYESLPMPRRDLIWDEMQEAITYGITWSAEANNGAGDWVRK